MRNSCELLIFLLLLPALPDAFPSCVVRKIRVRRPVIRRGCSEAQLTIDKARDYLFARGLIRDTKDLDTVYIIPHFDQKRIVRDDQILTHAHSVAPESERSLKTA
jgi:hypothetical protein